MASCDRCGTEFGGPARFCRKCGKQLSSPPPDRSGTPPTPDRPELVRDVTSPEIPQIGGHVDRPGAPPTPRRWSAPLVAAVAAAVIVVGAGSGAATWYLAGRGDPPAGGSGPVPAPPTATQPTTVPPTTSEAAVPATLAEQAEADRARAQALDGRWLPQLSSKTVGTRDDGITYDEQAILSQYRSLRDRYSGAVLVRSSDFTSFKYGGLWVVLATAPFGDAASANAWCADRNIGPDDCFAKRLSTTGGPTGNTVPR